MHHFKAKGGTSFNFNSDLSGHVRMNITDILDANTAQVDIPCADLIEFVEYVRREYGLNQEGSEVDNLADRVTELEEQVSLIRGHLVL